MPETRLYVKSVSPSGSVELSIPTTVFIDRFSETELDDRSMSVGGSAYAEIFNMHTNKTELKIYLIICIGLITLEFLVKRNVKIGNRR